MGTYIKVCVVVVLKTVQKQENTDVSKKTSCDSAIIVKRDAINDSSNFSALVSSDNGIDLVKQNCVKNESVIKQDLVTFQYSFSVVHPQGASRVFSHTVKGACNDIGVLFHAKTPQAYIKPKSAMSKSSSMTTSAQSLMFHILVNLTTWVVESNYIQTLTQHCGKKS